MSRASEELSELLNELARQPLDALPAAKLSALRKTVEKSLNEMKLHSLNREIRTLLTEIPNHYTALFQRMVRSAGFKDGTTAERKESYLRGLEKLKPEFEREAQRYADLLDSVYHASKEDEAISQLTALDKEERERLSLCANLSVIDNKGKERLYKLPASPNGVAMWLGQLRRDYRRNQFTLSDGGAG